MAPDGKIVCLPLLQVYIIQILDNLYKTESVKMLCCGDVVQDALAGYSVLQFDLFFFFIIIVVFTLRSLPVQLTLSNYSSKIIAQNGETKPLRSPTPDVMR